MTSIDTLELALDALNRIKERDGWKPFTPDPGCESDPWKPVEQYGLDAIAALEKKLLELNGPSETDLSPDAITEMAGKAGFGISLNALMIPFLQKFSIFTRADPLAKLEHLTQQNSRINGDGSKE